MSAWQGHDGQAEHGARTEGVCEWRPGMAAGVRHGRKRVAVFMPCSRPGRKKPPEVNANGTQGFWIWRQYARKANTTVISTKKIVTILYCAADDRRHDACSDHFSLVPYLGLCGKRRPQK
ncbi:MAG: hypothetical protein ACLT8E_06590 [Akkermansia sp.]